MTGPGLGQVAYEAWRSLFIAAAGAPPWDDLPAGQRKAWARLALTVCEEARRPDGRTLASAQQRIEAAVADTASATAALGDYVYRLLLQSGIAGDRDRQVIGDMAGTLRQRVWALGCPFQGEDPP